MRHPRRPVFAKPTGRRVPPQRASGEAGEFTSAQRSGAYVSGTTAGGAVLRGKHLGAQAHVEPAAEMPALIRPIAAKVHMAALPT